VAERETVLAVSELLEKKVMILQGSETLGEEEALMFSSTLLVIWYSWNLSSSVDWTRGHWQSYFWSLPMYRYADTTMKKFMSTSVTGIRMESV